MTNQRLQKLEMIIVTLHFNNYQKSEVLTLPFIGKFKVGYAPTNYSLDIGTLNINGQEAKTQWYHLETQVQWLSLNQVYQPNLNEAMSKDYAEAMPGVVKGLTEKLYWNPIICSICISIGGNARTVWGQYRQLESVTLTDKLPTYTDKNGNTRTAVLDTAKSEGWADNGDGTVSRRLQQMQTVIQQLITKNSWQNQEYKLPLTKFLI